MHVYEKEVEMIIEEFRKVIGDRAVQIAKKVFKESGVNGGVDEDGRLECSNVEEEDWLIIFDFLRGEYSKEVGVKQTESIINKVSGKLLDSEFLRKKIQKG